MKTRKQILNSRFLVIIAIALLFFSILATATSAKGVILLANSIDYSLNLDFTNFLKSKDIDVLHVKADNFDEYKTENFIIILGGHGAPEGVGNIVEKILTKDEKNYLLSSKDARKIFIKTDIWTEGQVVTIIAGYDEYDTSKALEENKEPIYYQKTVFGASELLQSTSNYNLDITPSTQDIASAVSSELKSEGSLAISYLSEHPEVTEAVTESLMEVLGESPELLGNPEELSREIKKRVEAKPKLSATLSSNSPKSLGFSWWDIIKLLITPPSMTVINIEDYSNGVYISFLATSAKILATTVESDRGVVGYVGDGIFTWPWSSKTFGTGFNTLGQHYVAVYPTILDRCSRCPEWVWVWYTRGFIVYSYSGAITQIQDLSCPCSELYEPICGSDGKTYPNKCYAECMGAEFSYNGTCVVSTTTTTITLPLCETDEDCVCTDCGCMLKEYEGMIQCLLLSPCKTGEETCRCIGGVCKSVPVTPTLPGDKESITIGIF